MTQTDIADPRRQRPVRTFGLERLAGSTSRPSSSEPFTVHTRTSTSEPANKRSSQMSSEPEPNAAVRLLSEGDGAKPRRMLSEKQVLGIVPIGRSTLWRMEQAGKFPKATPIGTNRRYWFEDQIAAWQNGLGK